ncbi:MAG: enoyl-CoA hydratase/isomerase family protein [Gammaproteobacteria bacterium]|nr:enoyl-CoA hydratase/isomerase family protein [Gammaproteobacteria bacterium]
MSCIQYNKDENQIAHLTFDKPNSPVNLMDNEFFTSLSEVVNKLENDDCVGVVLRSAKSTFFAGGDIDMLYQTSKETAGDLYNFLEQMKGDFRKLECLGKPVVACINGAALGGGLEVVLASHYRVAINSPKVTLGVPEVNWGLLPGAGGITRLVRMLGLDVAMPYLTQGKLFRPDEGHKIGLINDLADNEEQMLAKAIEWIKANPEMVQPYDVKGYKIPGLAKSRLSLPVAGAMVKSATKGTLPAPQAILATMVEGSQVDFDTACRIESRYLVSLACNQVSKNLINTFWYQQNEIKSGKNRPKADKTKFTKIGVLGAGMMGAGIAYACAVKGIQVVLKDVSMESAEKGKDYTRKLLQKRLDKGRATLEKMNATLDLITATDSADELAGCELVIEAVFEDRGLKAKVTQETEAVIADSAVFGSNTSTLPISGLAEASCRPEKFIGIHFFSPVDKMPLVEIIMGDKTDDETLAKAYDLTLQIGKTPIVVNDSRGFYTSRVFETFVKEGAILLHQADAAEIENAAWLAGFPVGPLAVTDEVSFTLIDKIAKQTEADLIAEGKTVSSHPGEAVIAKMVAIERSGKLHGAGYYNYPKGEAKHIWPELNKMFKQSDTSIPLQDIKDRLLFTMAMETVRIYEEGVLRSVGDANIGSIFGLGYPTWTGGTLQFINSYGVKAFVERADELAEKYGSRFAPTEQLRSMAATNQTF